MPSVPEEFIAAIEGAACYEQGSADPNAHMAMLSQSSIAVSLKRIADMMEEDRKPVSMREEDIERDPLMIIARAMEEIARPSLPQEPSRIIAISEREAKAIERIAKQAEEIGPALRRYLPVIAERLKA